MVNPEEKHLLGKSSRQTDQWPSLTSVGKFSTLPQINQIIKIEGLSVFFASLCVIDLLGVFPIITLPRVIINCGLFGLPIFLFVIFLQVITAVLLGKCWIIATKLDPTIDRKNRYPYAAVAEMTYGSYMSTLVTILLDTTIFSCVIPNLLLASQNLQLLGFRLTDGIFNFSFCYWLIIIGILSCPTMWLGSPKNMKGLACVSVVIVLMISTLVWISIISYQNEQGISFKDFNLESPKLIDILTTYGVMAFQFDLHPLLLTIEVDMQYKKDIWKVICYAMATTSTLSIVTTVLAAGKFGHEVAANILENLPGNLILYIAILLVTIQLCMSNAVGTSALFQHIEDIFELPRNFSLKRCLLRSLIVCIQVIIAEFVPRFDVIMGLIGGTLTGPLIFIFPSLFYLKILKMEKQFNECIQLVREESPSRNGEININTPFSVEFRDTKIETIQMQNTFEKFKNYCNSIFKECIFSSFFIVFGLTATIASTYYSLLKISEILNFNLPCSENTTYILDDL